MANMEQDSLLIQYFDGKFETIEVRLDDIDSTLIKQEANIDHHITRTDKLEKYVRENDALGTASTFNTSMIFMGLALTIMTFLIGKNFSMFKDIWKKLN